MKTEVFDLNSLQDNVSDDGTSIWDKDFLGRKEESSRLDNVEILFPKSSSETAQEPEESYKKVG